MSDTPLSRRTFLGTAGAVVAGSALLPKPVVAAPAILRSRVAAPVAIASANGLRGVARAVELVLKGTDPLDAAGDFCA